MCEQIAALPVTGNEIERRTVRHVVWHIVPFLGLLYLVNFLDRTNVSFAALRMNADIGISDALFGFGAGVFFF